MAMAEGWMDKTKLAEENTLGEEEGKKLNKNIEICLHLCVCVGGGGGFLFRIA